jgi:hypothetical protein
MTVTSATPKNIDLGVQDLSGGSEVVEQKNLPLHIPLFMSFAEKGSESPTYVETGFTSMFGYKTIDPTEKFFTHQTLFLNNIGGSNPFTFKRLMPPDIKPEANAVVYIDVLKTKLNNYKRNSDGSIVLDADGGYLINPDNPTIDGYKVKYIVEKGVDLDAVGVKPGIMGNTSSGVFTTDSSAMATKSTMYPLLSLKAKYKGEYYNNIGFSLMTHDNDTAPEDVVNESKLFPYKIRLSERPNSRSTGTVTANIYGELDTTFTLKRDSKNPTTNVGNSLSYVFNTNWNDSTNNIYSDFSDIDVNYDVVETLTKLFMEEELKHISTDVVEWADSYSSDTYSWYDFIETDPQVILTDEKYLFNILSGETLSGVIYQTFQIDNETPIDDSDLSELFIGEEYVTYLDGGGDGTINSTVFEELVTQEMNLYSDKASPRINIERNPANFVYDSGFSLDVKKAMIQFTSIRKDTIVVLGTHMNGRDPLSLSETISIGNILKIAMELTPESSVYGTGFTRGCVISGSGKIDEFRIPKTFSLGVKLSKYVNTSVMKPDKRFDVYPNNTIKELSDLEPNNIPETIYPKLYNAGLNYGIPDGLNTEIFPSFASSYDDDTSILKDFFVVIAISRLVKLSNTTWLRNTGNKLSRQALTDKITSFINKETQNAFDNRFTIKPIVRFTDEDVSRGYSWHLDIELYGQNMRTVQVSKIIAYRSE